MTSRDQRVVDTGPYRLRRHPGYRAILIVLAGIGVTYGNWLSLVALVALPLAGFVNRIPDAPQLWVQTSATEEPMRLLAEDLWQRSKRPPQGLTPDEFAAWSAEQTMEIRSRPDPEWDHRPIPSRWGFGGL